MKQQKGFTLIELIMVIVVLGILSAFALPRFVDFTSSASTAALEGALGSVRSSAAIAHASCLAEGDCNNATSISVEGVTVNLVNGYPSAEDADGIGTAANLDDFSLQESTDISDTTADVAGLIITSDAIGDASNDLACVFYIEATATTPPVTGLGTIGGAATPGTASCD